MKLGRNIKCFICGKEKFFSPCEIKERNFCSISCGSKFTKNGRFKKGTKCSEEAKKNLSKKHIRYKYKYEITEETRKKMIENARVRNEKGINCGENNYRWIKDRSKLKKQDRRNDSAYKDWRKQIYKRDNYKCKINTEECSGRIEAHHILRWRDHPELRYEVNNGILLCRFHHPTKRKDEEVLVEYYQELLKNNI